MYITQKNFYINIIILFSISVLSCSSSITVAKKSKKYPVIQIGKASFYNIKGKTASGEYLNPKAFTAAHKTLPFGSVVKVINLNKPNKSVVVKINDRGPYIKGRILDLTPAAFKRLAPLKVGVIKVKIKVLRLGKRKRRKRH